MCGYKLDKRGRTPIGWSEESVSRRSLYTETSQPIANSRYRMTLNNSKTSSKPRPGLSRKRESQLRAFHNLTSREDLPTPFGSNPYLGQTSSNATFPWAQNRQRFYSNTHKKSVMKELNFQKLFLEGRVVELEEEAPRDGPRTGVNEEQSQAQSQTDWRRIRLEKTLSIGRASMTVLVNLPNGVQMVLKAVSSVHGSSPSTLSIQSVIAELI